MTPFMLEIPNDLRHTRPFDLPAWQSIWKTFHFHSHSGLWLHQVQSDNGPMFDFMDTVLPSHYLSRYWVLSIADHATGGELRVRKCSCSTGPGKR